MVGLDDIPADLQGSASYRSRVGAAMVARACAQASTEAGKELSPTTAETSHVLSIPSNCRPTATSSTPTSNRE